LRNTSSPAAQADDVDPQQAKLASDGRRMVPRMVSRVVFPEPDGPVTITSSPSRAHIDVEQYVGALRDLAVVVMDTTASTMGGPKLCGVGHVTE
jgi:hypothetical protein